MTTRIPLALLLLAACTPSAPPADGAADDGAAHDEAAAASAPGLFDVPSAVRRNLGLEFAPVEVRPLSRTLRVPGNFELSPRARREVRMSLPGRVELLVDELDVVEVGQTLYRYQSVAWAEMHEEVLQAELSIDAAEAAAGVAAERYEEARAQLAVYGARLADLASVSLRRADLETQAELLRASLSRLEAERTQAAVAVDGARETHQHALHHAATAVGLESEELATYEGPLAWIEVRAAAPGVVEGLAVTDGAFVDAGGLVLTTVQPERLRFRALALQADLPRLSPGARARLVPAAGPGGAEASFELGVAGDAPTRTIVVWATAAEHAPWMRAGVAAFLAVVLEEGGADTFVVPRSAVVRDGLEHVVFRRDPDDPDVVRRVVADLGIADGDWVELRSGVARGDEVVSAGAFELRLATQQAGGPARGGHMHADGTFHEDH